MLWLRLSQTSQEFSGSASAKIWTVYISWMKQYPVRLPVARVNYGLNWTYCTGKTYIKYKINKIKMTWLRLSLAEAETENPSNSKPTKRSLHFERFNYILDEWEFIKMQICHNQVGKIRTLVTGSNDLLTQIRFIILEGLCAFLKQTLILWSSNNKCTN